MGEDGPGGWAGDAVFGAGEIYGGGGGWEGGGRAGARIRVKVFLEDQFGAPPA